MKVLKKLIPYAKPLHHFIPEYVVYTILGIIFGLLNFAFLIPVLNLLFKAGDGDIVNKIPAFSVSIDYIKLCFGYYLHDIIINNGKFKALIFVCSLIGGGTILSNVFKYMSVRVLMRLRLKLMNKLRSDIFEKYMNQSLAYHHNYSKGEGLMVLTSEVQEIESSVINSLQVLLRDPFIVLAYFIMLMYWSTTLTLFTLIFLPITGIVISSITKKLKKLNYFSQDTMSSMISFVNECLDGIRQVKSFTAEKLMLQKFNSINTSFSLNSKKLYAKRELATPISEVLGILAVLTLILFGGYLIIYGKTNLNGNGFIAYLALYTQIIQPLKNISQTSSTLQKGIVACERIFGVIDSPLLLENNTDAIPKVSFDQEIEIKNVSFGYLDKLVLRNICFNIKKGRRLALVGSSGSGKSTLVDLICRFYEVSDGSISIDGQNINSINITDLRELIAIVSQQAFLFNDTIANNIGLGKPEASRDDIIMAATIANAHNFIMQSESGYDTIVGEDGVKLSGGQKQRITIARAILKNAPILILDEATSALDTESERLVQDAINKMMENRTSIVIAHRLSTIRHADEIIVMQKGEIIERGNHEELFAHNGVYRKLIEMQEVK